MKWSILTVSHPDRARSLERLSMILADQIANLSFDLADEDGILPIEHVVVQAVGPVGDLRQQALDRAAGEYVNFVDDDDRVPGDYVERIFPLLDGVDYIGHRVQLYQDGVRRPPTIHSIRFRGWSQDDQGFYRGVSHLNPLRTELARLGSFSGGFGEDQRWGRDVEASGRVRSEHFVDETLYFYFWSSSGTLTAEAAA